MCYMYIVTSKCKQQQYVCVYSTIGRSFLIVPDLRCTSIPANFFWDISVRFLSWEWWDFWRWHDHFRRFPKKSEVSRISPKSSEDVQSLLKAKLSRKLLCTKSEIARKVLSFIHFTHGFCSLHGSELTYFWKLCQARRQQLTFFNQAWEIGPQAWAGVRSKFSTRRRESWQVYN